MPPPAALLDRLRSHGQDAVLAGWDRLSAAQQTAFAAQLDAVDLAELADLRVGRGVADAVPLSDLRPVPAEDADATPADARAVGEAALRRGEVAALVVAGGQGTRLGSNKPKGLYPVGPLTGKSLFQWHAEGVLALSRRFGRPLPLLVMTSPATDSETRTFFANHRNFALAAGQVRFFVQGTMPAVDLATGRLLLEAPGKLALSPNGHGGTLTALADSGELAKLEAGGVRHVFYFQVDNPLVRIAEPGFVGRHVQSGSEVSSKVVAKEQPGERVGVLALVGGRCGIVEYSDLPKELAERRTADGRLAFDAGNIAVHLFSVEFLKRVTAGADKLPYHRAKKKVPAYDPTSGAMLTPASENALKFERFVFDALPKAERWLVVRVRREDEFAPLKNATGADSPESVRYAILDRSRRWLGLPDTATFTEVGPLDELAHPRRG